MVMVLHIPEYLRTRSNSTILHKEVAGYYVVVFKARDFFNLEIDVLDEEKRRTSEYLIDKYFYFKVDEEGDEERKHQQVLEMYNNVEKYMFLADAQQG